MKISSWRLLEPRKGSWRYKFKKGIVNLIWQGRYPVRQVGRWWVSWVFLELKMERKRSGIPGKNEAAGSASSTPYYGKDKESTSLCQFWNRRRVPMWIFLTSFDDESREDFGVWNVGGENVRRNKWIPRKEAVKDLATFSATEKVCTVKIFLTSFFWDISNGKRKMSDDNIIKRKSSRENENREDIFQNSSE